jgi:iron(III) transport system ATP-binding protein
VLVRPQDIEFTNGTETTLMATVSSSVFRGERYDIGLTLEDGQRLLAFSDEPMKIASEHTIAINQAWSLEREQ